MDNRAVEGGASAPGRSGALFALICVAYVAYSALFIYRTSFVLDGERYFSLFDDAMISMRYARNLAEGYGLVWNPNGERVEGYSNLLWVLAMALLHLLPVAESKVSLLVQAGGALFLLANLFFVKRIAELVCNSRATTKPAGSLARSPAAGRAICPDPAGFTLALPKGSTVVPLGAVLLTAFYLPLNYWGLMGMEVGVLVLVTSVAVWRALECLRLHRPGGWLWGLLGMATLVRMDMVVPFLALLSFLLIADPVNRRGNLLLGAGSLLFFVGAQTAFRLYYYGDVLPNTYYLKLAGYPLLERATKGLAMYAKLVWNTNWMLVAVSLGVLLFRRDRVVLLLFWLLLAESLYSIYVGGDAWERGGTNRYLSSVVPLFFVLCCYGFHLIVASMKVAGGIHGYFRKWSASVVVALMFASLVNLNATFGPRALLEWLLIAPPYQVEANRGMVRLAHLLRDVTTPDATIAVVWAGAIPYFSGRTAVDLLGKNDRRVAHLDVRPSSGLSRLVEFYPGHTKWDYGYSVGELKPDVVAQWWMTDPTADPSLQAGYRQVEVRGWPLYLREDSSHILWDQVQLSS